MEQGPRGLRGTSFFLLTEFQGTCSAKTSKLFRLVPLLLFSAFFSLSRFHLAFFLALLRTRLSRFPVSLCLSTLDVGHPTRRCPGTVESPTPRCPDPPRTGLGQSSHRFSFLAKLRYPPYLSYPRHMPHALAVRCHSSTPLSISDAIHDSVKKELIPVSQHNDNSLQTENRKVQRWLHAAASFHMPQRIFQAALVPYSIFSLASQSCPDWRWLRALPCQIGTQFHRTLPLHSCGFRVIFRSLARNHMLVRPHKPAPPPLPPRLHESMVTPRCRDGDGWKARASSSPPLGVSYSMQ